MRSFRQPNLVEKFLGIWIREPSKKPLYDVISRGVVNQRLVPKTNTAADVLAEKRFEGHTSIQETRVVIGLTVTELLPENLNRVFWKATNRSGNDGAIGFSRNLLTFANGDLVNSNGDVSADIKDDGEIVTQQVFAINNIAGGTWYIAETVRG